VKVIFFNLIERKKILICKKKEKQEREMISQSRQKSLRELDKIN
jgi:bifunctional DNA-binding transcriptional regulator/antitoxin component of YhaV-PrlF toxin-antitoxin module